MQQLRRRTLRRTPARCHRDPALARGDGPYLPPRGTAACGSPPAVTFFARRGGHTTWTCRTCDQTVYRPPLKTPCTCISVSSCRPDKFRRARCAVAEGEVIYPVHSLN